MLFSWTKQMKPSTSLVALSLLHTSYVFSTPDTPNYHPRATGQFLAGSNQQLGGFGDVMYPFLTRPDSIFFADGTLMFGQSQRATYSGGVGHRGIYSSPLGDAILGAYIFGDYYQSQYNSVFWQANPGLEFLTTRREARLQAYIPLSSRRHTLQRTFADNIPTAVINDAGTANQLYRAQNHSIINTPVSIFEDFGPGVELEVGQFFDYGKGVWVRGGGIILIIEIRAKISVG